jgi:hypothetical protein
MDASAEEQKAYGQLVARAMSDPAFRAELEADPRGVLAAGGVTVADGTTLVVVESPPAEYAPDTLYVVVPTDDALDEDALADVAGGNATISLYNPYNWFAGANLTPQPPPGS